MLRLKKVEDENEILNRKVAELEAKLNSSPTAQASNWSKFLSTSDKKSNEQRNVINSVASDIRERQRNEKNVCIFGLAQSLKVIPAERATEDREKVEEIFSKINVSPSIVKFHRFKPRNESVPGLVLVELASKEERNEVLRAAKRLKEEINFERVFINPDLTLAERELSKELRQKRDELNEKLKNNNKGEEYVYVNGGDKVVKKQK